MGEMLRGRSLTSVTIHTITYASQPIQITDIMNVPNQQRWSISWRQSGIDRMPHCSAASRALAAMRSTLIFGTWV